MKTLPTRRLSRLAPALFVAALCPILGCMGASDDRLGSGNASKEGSGIDAGAPINTTTQQNRNDKGDNPSAIGTSRPPVTDAGKTGGMGEYRGTAGHGENGPASSSAPGVGPR